MTSTARFAQDGLHHFVIHAVSRKGGKLNPESAGAYVSCWINFPLYEGALELAKYYVRAEGWSVRAVDSHAWINGPQHASRGTVRYYRKALKEGAALVFHHYSRPEA